MQYKTPILGQRTANHHRFIQADLGITRLRRDF
ncbi:Uncharacterised protein [Klebsiella pneumoniae]|nr:Uncharacterised protein [Klebsiella pneumoniae]